MRRQRPTKAIAQILREQLSGLDAPRVLEAGCGRKSVDWGANVWVVGIDEDADGLAQNEQIDEKILGDLNTHPLPAESFDVVACRDVLEHLPEPQKAMLNMLGAVKPGGVMIWSMPNPTSLKALATKATPHRFHVWVYRRILGMPHAGEPGFAPFPVFLRPAIKPSAVRAFAKRHGLTVEILSVYEGGQMRRLARQRPILYGCAAALSGVLFVLSLGTYHGLLTDTCAVLRKPRRRAATKTESVERTARAARAG